MKLQRFFLLVVLMPLLLVGCGGKDPEGGGELPPPTPVNPGGGGGGGDTPGETHPWDANRGKVVRPKAGNGWTVTTIEDGVDYYAFDGKESVTGTNQHIYVTDIDLSKPYSVKLGYYSPTTTASKVFAQNNAVAVINCGYEKAALYLKVNGTTLSTITATTIGDTGVPQWKSEAALYLNQDQDVRIEFTGKDMTLAQWRTTYTERAKSENTFITSAPMLIDDYEPVGEQFCDKHPKSAYLDKDGKDSNSENPYNHQGSDTNPRTAIAKTENNHVLLIVVDGRRNGFAKGISAKNLTKFLVNNFNPQYALNLDGGGSSTMCVKGQGDPETHVVNYPCDNRSSEGKDGSPKETSGPDHAGQRPRDTFIMILKK
jgi:hypothetical protein